MAGPAGSALSHHARPGRAVAAWLSAERDVVIGPADASTILIASAPLLALAVEATGTNGQVAAIYDAAAAPLTATGLLPIVTRVRTTAGVIAQAFAAHVAASGPVEAAAPRAPVVRGGG